MTSQIFRLQQIIIRTLPPSNGQRPPILHFSSQKYGACILLILYWMRYAKQRRPNLLPSIQSSPSQLQQILAREQSLEAQVEQLNQLLKSDHLTTINGFIFTTEVKNRLSDDIMECISKHHRLLAYGFQLWRSSNYETSPIKMELVHTKPTFKEKLLEVSIRSVEKYEYQKNKQLERLQDSRWKVNSTAQSKVSSTNKLKTQFTSIKESNTSIFKNQQKNIYNYNTAKKIVTEAPQREEQIGPQEVEKMLKKLSNVVSIWLPPKSYPHFYGIIVPSLAQTNQGPKCRIKKYMLFKQGLNQRFFTGILEYLSFIFHMDIDSMQMIMTKGSYLSYFKNCGWKMKSWEGVDKINAIFNRCE